MMVDLKRPLWRESKDGIVFEEHNMKGDFLKDSFDVGEKSISTYIECLPSC